MEKYVVIGTGFIGEYMGRGMRNVSGEDLSAIARGVKGHPNGAREKAAQLGYPVTVNDTATALEQINPTIVILSPPPELAPAIVQEIMAPYFAQQREKGATLPDVYSFIPSPSADWVCQQLGGDVNVVKILPNILDVVCGYDLSAIGINYVSYAAHPWREERKAVLYRHLAPYGYTARTNDVDSLVLLAGKITSHVCYEVSYTINSACAQHGVDLPVNTIGAAMRTAQYQLFPEMPVIGTCSDADVPEQLKPFFAPFMQAWYKGLHRFTMEHRDTVSIEDAQHIDMCSFALNVFPIQYKSRPELEQDTKNAATKGGILERGIEYFFEDVEKGLYTAIESIMDGLPATPEFYAWVEAKAYTMSCEAYKRSLDLSGKK